MGKVKHDAQNLTKNINDLEKDFELCEAYLDKHEYHLAGEIVERLEPVMDDYHDKDSDEYGRFMYQKGCILLDRQQTAKGENCLTIAEEIFQKHRNHKYLCSIYNRLGSLEHRLGQYQMAIRLYTSAINHSKKANNKLLQTRSYNNIGVTKRHLRSLDSALENFEQALKLAEENKYFDMVGGIYSNIGAVHGMQDNVKEAIDYQEKAVEMMKAYDGKFRIIQALNNLGRTYMLNDQLDEAQECYEEIKEFLGDSEEYMTNLLLLNNNLGQLFSQKNELEVALDYFLEALRLSETVGSLANKRSVYQHLGNLYERLGNYQESLVYFKKYYEIQNKIVEENTKDSINQLVARFELKQQRQERETYKILNDELKRSNRDLERFAYVASHDMKEPLRMVNTYLGLIEKRYGNVLDDNGKEFIRYAVDGGNRMTQLLDGLLNYSRVTTRAKDFEETNLQDVLDFVLKNLELVIKEKNAEINYTQPLPVLKCDQVQFNQLFQNLISNSLKFMDLDKKPVINIRIMETEEKFHFEFEDNGIGIDPKYHDQVFEILTRVHPRAQYEGSGIGLSVVRKIVQRHNGKVWLDSAVGKGTTMFFDIPKNL